MWTHVLIHHKYMVVIESNQNSKEMWLKSINILIDSKSLRVVQGYHCYLIDSNDSIDLVMASSAWEWESSWLRFTTKQRQFFSNCSLIMNMRYLTCRIHHRKNSSQCISWIYIKIHKNQYMQDSDNLRFSLRCLVTSRTTKALGMVSPNHPRKFHCHSFLLWFNETG